MDTECRYCVFAEFDGLKQTQCKLDRLEKFSSQGTEVVEVVLEDGDESYFRILGRFCNACHDRESMDGIPARKWESAVRKQIVPTVTMAVYVGPHDTHAECRTTLESIVGQTLPPAEILIVYNQGGKPAPPAYAQWLIDNAGSIPWRVENVLGKHTVSGEFEEADYGKSVDIAVTSNAMKSRFFVVANAGYRYDSDYVEVIDNAINVDLIRFVALLPDEDGNGLFVQTGLHKLLQGNQAANGCNTIMEKIESIASEEGNLHMIKRFEDLRE